MRKTVLQKTFCLYRTRYNFGKYAHWKVLKSQGWYNQITRRDSAFTMTSFINWSTYLHKDILTRLWSFAQSGWAKRLDNSHSLRKNYFTAVGVVLWSACWPSYPTIWVQIPLKPTVFSIKILLEKNKNKEKRGRGWPI